MREEIKVQATLTFDCDADDPLEQQLEGIKIALSTTRHLTAVEVPDISPEAKTYQDVWAEDPDHSSEQWKYEVENDDTRRGYWDWVEAQRT